MDVIAAYVHMNLANVSFELAGSLVPASSTVLLLLQLMSLSVPLDRG